MFKKKFNTIQESIFSIREILTQFEQLFHVPDDGVFIRIYFREHFTWVIK